MKVTFYKSGPNGRETVKSFDKDNILLPLRRELVKFEGDDTIYGVIMTTNVYKNTGECSLEIELSEGDFE